MRPVGRRSGQGLVDGSAGQANQIEQEPIGGRVAVNVEAVQSINPATGHLIQHYPAMSADVLVAALEEAGTSAMAWARVEVDLRASMLERVATLLEAKRETFVRLITQEVGKPLAEARAELDKCAAILARRAGLSRRRYRGPRPG